MSIRKLGGALAGVAAMATMSALTVTGAQAATPAGAHKAAATCSVTVHLQPRVSIAKSATKVPVKLTGCNGTLVVAVAQLLTSRNKFWDSLGWDDTHRTSVTGFKISDAPKPGTYKIGAEGGSVEGGAEIGFTNAPTTQVKYGTRAAISTTRKSSKVTVSTKLSRYTSGGFKAYPHVKVGFQVRARGTKTWKTIGFSKTSSTGRASIKHTDKHKAYYRVFSTSTGSYWAATSGSSLR